MQARNVLSLLAVAVFLGATGAGSAAYGQAKPCGAVDIEPASSKVIDGVTYDFDADGNPLYYDDSVHHNRPRRFYYSNGGWVMARSGYGHDHSRYANTGLHKRGGQAGQGAQTRNSTRVRKAETGDAATGGKSRQVGDDNKLRDGRGTGTTKTATGVRAGKSGKSDDGARAGKANTGRTAGATKGTHGVSGGKAGQASGGAGAGQGGKSGSSPARSAAAGSSSGRPGGGSKSASDGGSGGRRGPK